MGKRHQASRRKSYGRRQHEIRERFDRPHGASADIASIEVFEVQAYDAPRDDPFAAFDLSGSRAGLRLALGK
jgi:hypothetical protein